ncbi:MAG: pilin [Patescibacteria group bacterium]
MKNFFLSISFVCLLLALTLSPGLSVQAASVSGPGNTNGGSTAISGPGNTTCSPNSSTLCNPLGQNTTVYSLVGRIISVILGLVGSIALVMFIYGGLLWMTSAGAADRVKKGREAILWSVIGMAVIFASYGLTKFLIENITT